jgi:hypothetical protein
MKNLEGGIWMLRHKWRKLAIVALTIVLATSAVYGCAMKEVLNPTEETPSAPGSTSPATRPTEPTQSEPANPSLPTAPQPVEYSLTGLWFWLDSSYQAGNSGENFANFHSGQINVSVSWESMPEGCSNSTEYVQSFVQNQSAQWDAATAGEKHGVAYGSFSTNKGRHMVLGVYSCGKMVGKIVADGTGVLPQELIDIVTSGRVDPNQVPGLNPLPPKGYQIVKFGGLYLQISDLYEVTEEPDNVTCSYGETAIMLCYDSLANYPDCKTAEEIAAHNAAQYNGVWESIETNGATILLSDNNGHARILVYYLKGETLWEVSASGVFTPTELAQMCQLLTSAQITI